MKFRFPIVIIDEDFRSENASGLGIRALADAIEKEGMEVLGVTSYGDLSQFAQQQSRASAFIDAASARRLQSGTPRDAVRRCRRSLRKGVGPLAPDFPAARAQPYRRFMPSPRGLSASRAQHGYPL